MIMLSFCIHFHSTLSDLNNNSLNSAPSYEKETQIGSMLISAHLGVIHKIQMKNYSRNDTKT